MTITREFKLCLNAGTASAPFINVNQYDEGEEWYFSLYHEDGSSYTPSSGAIIGLKADNNAILNAGSVVAGKVLITETQQMTAAAGRAIYELLIDGETHGTANFIVNVERRPSDDAEFSDSDLSMLQEAINSAAEIEDLLDGQDVPTVITPIISDWLDENITNPSNPPIDTSLTVAGAAADAKVTGDEITDLKSALDDYYFDTFYDTTGMSKNLVNPEKITKNISISSTGNEQTSVNYDTTELINLPMNTRFSFKAQAATGGNGVGYISYYLNGVWITRDSTTYSDGLEHVSKTPTELGITKYNGVRLSYGISSTERMANVGTTLLPYSPYGHCNFRTRTESEYFDEATNMMFVLVGGKKYQYLPPISEWETGYWDGKPVKVSNASYRCTHLNGFKAGTYYVSNFTEWQSFIVNINSGEITTFNALGLTTNTDGSFTVDFDFNLYITTNKVTTNSKFTNAALPPMWRYGAYGFDGDSYTVAKDGSGDFASLVEAVNYACQFMGSKVYVGAGTWNIIDELGADYLSNVGDTQRGLYLKNRIHVVCDSKAVIQANYTGDLANVKQWLSIFNSGQYGFTLENAVLIGSNIRYLLHDERDTDTDAYTNKYLNCTMVFDNRENTAWSAKQCIGGGLGQNGYVDIEGCSFKSYQGYDGTVSYHNSAGANAKSHIVLRDCYFYFYNTFRLSWYGTSTEITEALVTGCYLGADIVHRAENSSATVENTSVVSWNNTVNPH